MAVYDDPFGILAEFFTFYFQSSAYRRASTVSGNEPFCTKYCCLAVRVDNIDFNASRNISDFMRSHTTTQFNIRQFRDPLSYQTLDLGLVECNVIRTCL